MICSLIAASQSSAYFWRARESCGTVGTRSSSFLTSSKGSNTTPIKGLLFAPPFEAHNTKFVSLLAGEKRRLEEARAAEEFRGENENEDGCGRGDRVSTCGFKREHDGTVLRSMILKRERKTEWKREKQRKGNGNVCECWVCGEGEWRGEDR